jgi:RimJ/RimL family protein N-acetyltransferase
VVQQLAHEIWREHYPAIISGDQIEFMLEKLYNRDALRQQMDAPNHAFWLVQDADRQTVGFIVVEDQGQNAHFIHKFYLSVRNSGLGSEVLSLLIAMLPARPVLRLFVNRRNYKSVNFYFKNGFKIRDWIDQRMEHGFVLDDFLMEYQSPA